MGESCDLGKRVCLHGLEPEVAELLTVTLRSTGCMILDATPAATPRADAEVVFCSCDRAVLLEALRASRGRPVVVVSRLPDVTGWLDALDAGAADYIAAPFEAVQLRWLFASERFAGKKAATAFAA